MMPLVLANANVLWIFITLLLLAKIHILNRDMSRRMFDEETFNRYNAFTQNKTEQITTSTTVKIPQTTIISTCQ